MLDRSDGHEGAAPSPRDGRALVLREVRPAAGNRPLADFLTQLIACDRRLPTYRAARRQEPEAAATAYAGRTRGSETKFDLSV